MAEEATRREPAEVAGVEMVGAEITGTEGVSVEVIDVEIIDAETTGAETTGAEATGAEMTGVEVVGAEILAAEWSSLSRELTATVSATSVWPMDVDKLTASGGSGPIGKSPPKSR